MTHYIKIKTVLHVLQFVYISRLLLTSSPPLMCSHSGCSAVMLQQVQTDHFCAFLFIWPDGWQQFSFHDTNAYQKKKNRWKVLCMTYLIFSGLSSPCRFAEVVRAELPAGAGRDLRLFPSQCWSDRPQSQRLWPPRGEEVRRGGTGLRAELKNQHLLPFLLRLLLLLPAKS